MIPTIKHNKGNILFISDMHIPYQHKDNLAFLKRLHKDYNFTTVVSVGDEVDYHAMSFHDSDPDLLSAGEELKESIKILQSLYKLFPNIHLVDSNHGSMVYRKGKHHGMSRHMLKSYNEILEAPPGWKWHNNLLIEQKDSSHIFITHGVSKNGSKLAQQMGCNVVQGHYHTEFNIVYHSSPSQLYWSLQVGCSIDDSAMAFAYNKTTTARPIIGHAGVVNGFPRLFPMLLDKNGHWTGKGV